MINETEFDGYVKGIGLTLAVIVSSEEKKVKMEGAAVITTGLREMYDQLDAEYQDEFLYVVKLILMALAIIAERNDEDTSMKGSQAIMASLGEFARGIYS